MDLHVANLVVAATLAGLIWTIQLVHYPLFALVGEDGWQRYEADHQRRITWVALPLMSANVGVAVLLLIHEGSALATVNAVIAVGLFAATGLVYAPLHGQLAAAFSPVHIKRLVRLNWLRTVAWTGQVAVAVALVLGSG